MQNLPKEIPLSLPLPVTTSARSQPTSLIPHVSIPGYMLVSSTMLIINKVAIHLFPFPFFLLSVQLLSSVLIMLFLRSLKLLDLQFVSLTKLNSYYGVVFFFLLNILSNIKALQYSNVETVIVFRTCTTLAIAYCDYRFLRLSKPSPQVILSIVIIVLGALIYLLMDSQLKVESMFWATLYFVIQCCEVLYVKYITSSVPMSSWTRSFYNNLIALPFITIAAIFLGETLPLMSAYENGDLTQGCLLMVALSCGMGLMISWTGFVCREQVSATAFSVLGNVNKILTVAINCMIWDKHSSASGIAGLLLSLLGGGLYSHFASKPPAK